MNAGPWAREGSRWNESPSSLTAPSKQRPHSPIAARIAAPGEVQSLAGAKWAPRSTASSPACPEQFDKMKGTQLRARGGFEEPHLGAGPGRDRRGELRESSDRTGEESLRLGSLGGGGAGRNRLVEAVAEGIRGWGSIDRKGTTGRGEPRIYKLGGLFVKIDRGEESSLLPNVFFRICFLTNFVWTKCAV
jgi:hypothetical protein